MSISSMPAASESRVLSEGYGPGAWHGPDLKAALVDVKPPLAFWRPASGRHNIAELVLHHAYFVRAVRSQISGRAAEAFVLPGEDWFVVTDQQPISWSKIQATLESEQRRLGELVAGIEAGAPEGPPAARPARESSSPHRRSGAGSRAPFHSANHWRNAVSELRQPARGRRAAAARGLEKVAWSRDLKLPRAIVEFPPLNPTTRCPRHISNSFWRQP